MLLIDPSNLNDDLHIPKHYTYHLLIAALLGIFALLFCIIYNPADIESLTANWSGPSHYFHILMIACITFTASCLCRLVLWALQTRFAVPTWRYILFCICEITVIASFIALYSSLFSHQKYLEILPDCEIFAALILVYPYAFSIVLRISSNRLAALNASKEGVVGMAKFYDENKKMKFAVDPSAILYIESSANYVKINYIENDIRKVYLLRNSMKGVSEVALKSALVRCHRSFFINPKQIKSLSRNKENLIVAELKIKGLDPVPVSKPYYDAIVEKL